MSLMTNPALKSMWNAPNYDLKLDLHQALFAYGHPSALDHECGLVT